MIIRKPTLTTAATFDPVSSVEIKKHLEIADADTVHDAHLTRLMKAATEIVQGDSGLVLCASTWTYKLDGWPCEYITLPVRPVASVTINYLDSLNVSQLWAAGNYVLDTSAVTPTIYLSSSAVSWPTVYDVEGNITITLVAGHATQAAIPYLFKQLLLLKIAQLFFDRGETAADDDRMAYERLLRRALRSSYP